MTDQAICLSWTPVVRDNPRSTLRGYLDLETPSGLILRALSVLTTERVCWVVIPSRLRLHPDGSNVPVGVGDAARFDVVVEFVDRATRDRFNAMAIDALRRAYSDALGNARARSEGAYA